MKTETLSTELLHKMDASWRAANFILCAIAHNGQFLDVHHRPGNVHDSNGAADFMRNCFKKIKSELNGAISIYLQFE